MSDCTWRGGMVVALCAVMAVGCGSADDERLVVFAASSLADVFDDLEIEFERQHEGVDVVMNVAGSATLVAQLADGAPADVVATADLRTMDEVVSIGTPLSAPVVFATNSMVIAVERGNPLGIGGVGDLAEGPIVVLAAPEVPAGTYAADVLACSGVAVEAASLEQSVRAAAAKVALGEADAALVYRTDLTGDLEGVEIDPACNVRAVYPILALNDSALAREFAEFVAGPDAAVVLRAAGFGSP